MLRETVGTSLGNIGRLEKLLHQDQNLNKDLMIVSL